ncbi:hypothetical protein Taro_046826 [Colocasia esculenta]|uniref:RNase H type-1 domain-containing protein n=1 Tax=Colocasia esculenta TaxID=4460 RepID=A0A843X301_COLES|nr:hypothetical protein [Colocasia esculenta]
MSAQHIINRSWLFVQAICISANFQKIPQIWREALRQPSNDEVNRDTMAPKVAKWFTPPKGRLKLNVDGAFKMTTNEAGGGGILRDHKGNMSCAFAKPYYHLKPSLAAEEFELRDGLLMCCNKGITEVQVETDSLNLLQIVTGQLPCLWDLACILHEIAMTIKEVQAEISHIPRESNQVADCLADFAYSCVHLTIWDSWADLPNIVKPPYRFDKVGSPPNSPSLFCTSP